MGFKSPAVDAIRIVENAMEMRMVIVYVAGHEAEADDTGAGQGKRNPQLAG